MAVQEPNESLASGAETAVLENEALAPPVVAVVVTHDAGPWLEQVLDGFGAQDYPNLSVLVVDAASREDPLPRIAATLPSAYVRRLDTNPGFGAAANEVLNLVEGASFFAFCHDDVMLDPNAIRALVEEAYRSNAGVVGPKVVSWGAPTRLLQVGLSADKIGVVTPMVERGELDQEQHDRVRDVFTIPGACTLVRADLFQVLGGFDPAITLLGEDLDLCWRAQVAGARVVVVPAARAEHREALDTRTDIERERLASRHRLRTVLTCYSLFHLVRVLPQAALFHSVELVYALGTRRLDRARTVAGSWWWNLRRLGDIRARRALVRSTRRLPDGEVRRLQVRGSARFTALARGEVADGERLRGSLADVGRGISGRLESRSRQVALAAWVVIVLLLLIGSRGLLGGRIPAVAGLAPFDDGPLSLLREYASGWRSAGLGSEAPAPTAFALLGLAGLGFLGGMGLLQQVLVLGALPLGALGAWRLTASLDSPKARAVAVVVYACVPLPYEALTRGGWGGLVLYAAAPWILSRLFAATGDAPFDASAPSPKRWRPVVALGILTALVGAFVPAVVVLVPALAVVLMLAALVTGGVGRAARAVPLAVGGSVLAVGLHVPWALDFLLPGSSWSAVGGVASLETDRLGVGELLRFQTGPGGASVLGWAVIVAAALPLVIGRDWRLTWAVRAWLVALGCWALVWAGRQGWLPVALPPAEVVLAPGAAALALAAALGVAAFERDLPGYGFGWRQVASLAGGVAVVAGIVPLGQAALDGRWDLPDVDFARTLAFMQDDEVTGAGAFRVLWVGPPQVLPVGSYRLDDDLAYGLSNDGRFDVSDRWSGTSEGATALVGEALRLAGDGQTDRLGRLLAPLGIRYVAVPSRGAPARAGAPEQPVPAGLDRTVARQLDLRRVDLDPALDLFENDAWAPVRAVLSEEAAAQLGESATFAAAVALDLSASEPVLGSDAGHERFTGEVSPGAVYLAEASSSRWELRVDGDAVDRTAAFGWANAFTVPARGQATLAYRTSPVRWLAIALQAALWLAAIRVVGIARRDERRSPTAP